MSASLDFGKGDLNTVLPGRVLIGGINGDHLSILFAENHNFPNSKNKTFSMLKIELGSNENDADTLSVIKRLLENREDAVVLVDQSNSDFNYEYFEESANFSYFARSMDPFEVLLKDSQEIVSLQQYVDDTLRAQDEAERKKKVKRFFDHFPLKHLIPITNLID